MPTTVIAKAGQTLCELAIAAGFIDCDPIRNFGSNAGKKFLNTAFLEDGDVVVIPDVDPPPFDGKGVETTHNFEKKNAPAFLIRFVHGSPDKPYRQDSTTTVLNISNWPTNKAGVDLKSNFPSATKFDKLGHDDPDTFKLEIVDPGGPAKIQAKLEALKPIFAADGSVDHFEPFTGAEKADRSLDVTAEQVSSKVCYRSPYIRLVVDKRDKDAVPKQTLMIADTTDGKDGDKDKVEILGQHVRASYERTRCKRSTKCTATAEVPVGEDIKKVKVCAHILKDPANGNPLSTDEQVSRTLLMYMRQVYAQANLTVKIIAKARDIVAPANMIVVDDREGRDATGNGKIDVKCVIDGTFDKTVSVVTGVGDSTLTTANAIVAALNAVLPAGITARSLANPAIFGKTKGSADVIVGDPLKNNIRVSVLASGDAKQKVRAVAITKTTFDSGTGNERNTGSQFSRVLLNNYDTGRDRVDIFVVGDMPDLLGLAFPSWKQFPDKYGHPAARDEVANSFLVASPTLQTPGGAENFYTTIPQEIGHVLTDAVHTPKTRPTELMGPGSPVGSDERVVNGCKRITDLFQVQFDDNIKGIPVKMFREDDVEVLE
jgi:hypothetical protein